MPAYTEIYTFEGPEAGFPRCANLVRHVGDHCRMERFKEWSFTGSSYEILRIRSPESDGIHPVVMPPGTYFVMGDNRDDSQDSRMPWEFGGLGPVSAEQILGEVVFTFRMPWTLDLPVAQGIR